MAEIVFFGNEENALERVYALGRREKIESFGECVPGVIDRFLAKDRKEELRSVKYAFATWGFPDFTKEEIREYFPSLECLFYAAGTVKNFAEKFLSLGVRVFSSRLSNAIPVAETVFAQIILANKGYFRATRAKSYAEKKKIAGMYKGNFETSVGIVGAGIIGSMVAERLKMLNVRVLAWDKFMSDEKARRLNVEKVSLETLFSECDVISNHLADKPETQGILDYKLFSLMKENAAFINSGRGRQVNETDLLRALKEKSGRTAVLDVTYPEPPEERNALYALENVFLSPHIDGSTGNETVRLADEMIEAFCRVKEKKHSDSEVFADMLKTMA